MHLHVAKIVSTDSNLHILTPCVRNGFFLTEYSTKEEIHTQIKAEKTEIIKSK